MNYELMDEEDLIATATSRLYRDAKANGFIPMQPAHGASEVETVDGTSYVVLRNTNEVVGLYRLTAHTMQRCTELPAGMAA